MLHLRFIEVLPATEGAEHLALGPGEERVPVEAGIAKDDLEEDLQIDDDFLRRVREA
jgi:hypothetical protein